LYIYICVKDKKRREEGEESSKELRKLKNGET
jgi:hypothetical protein